MIRAVRQRLSAAAVRLWRLVKAAVDEYMKDFGPQMASAMSYGFLFTIFPLTIFLVAVLGVVMRNDDRREEVTTWLLENLPLSQQAGIDLTAAVSGIASPASLAGLLALAASLWAASGMMASIRAALTNIWKPERTRSIVRGKLFDLLLVLVAGVLLLASFGVTIAVRVVQQASEDAAESLGAFGSVVFAAGELTEIILPLSLTLLTFILLYRYVPVVRPPWQELWAPALAAAVAAELLKTGFAYYLAYFSRYNVVYGSLGAVVAFLFLVYLTATVFLLGAELAASRPRARARLDSKPDVREVHLYP